MGVIYHNNKSKVFLAITCLWWHLSWRIWEITMKPCTKLKEFVDLLWNKEKKLFHHIRIQETREFKDPSFWGAATDGALLQWRR